ncbi:hypothetical protein BJ944DRAFT_198260 [Cunninghamella echinulata]|nr:hypothetical protein BJ944DRAFT_198260 [Cunninghamella echinulata]
MSESELELYQFQLDQVEHSLKSDPTNEELLKLQTDLKELIALTAQYEQQATTSSSNNETISTPTDTDKQSSSRKRSRSPSTPPTTAIKGTKTSALVTHQFSIGQEVKAKWSQDGQYYRAIITAIGGADQIFSVQFRGYKDIEVVPLSDIQPLEKDKKKGIFEDISSPSSGNNHNTNNNINNNGSISSSISTFGGGDDDHSNTKQKKKDNNNINKKAKKVSEVEVKKSAWLNFASSGDKKKKKQKVSAINKKSIFKTPDNPDSKVGVVGSGRGMTSYRQQRGRHAFDSSNIDE